MKRLTILLVAILFGTCLAKAVPPKNGHLYLYKVTVLDEAKKSLPGSSLYIETRGGGVVSDSNGVITVTTSTMFLAKDVIEVSKEGFLSEKLVFDETSDGLATVILKKDPNAKQPVSKKKRS